MSENFTKLPKNLPIPEDDGACNHLLGEKISTIILPDTRGNFQNLAKSSLDYLILYFFPMMGIPGKELPKEWDDIPGARGCTPQNIAISQMKDDLIKYSAMPVGVSTQSLNELTELSQSRKFSQLLVSDENLEFQKKLKIPTFNFNKKIMYKRLTLIVKNSEIVQVFYPVFPPDEHVSNIIDWFEENNRKKLL